MKLVKALLFGLSLTAAAGVTLAGEDSTDRYHCTGTTFYDSAGGLTNFNQADTECGAMVQR